MDHFSRAIRWQTWSSGAVQEGAAVLYGTYYQKTHKRRGHQPKGRTAMAKKCKGEQQEMRWDRK